MATWQEVRVFISSTFRDMHAERDWLVKRVFPQLRERLEPYRIRLVDIDLRWGITEEEAENDRVLDLCLDEIDNCRPFFIGVLGERYGWVPTSFDPDALSKHDWIQGLTGKSITELEILYGVLRNPEMHPFSFFYFRDPAFIDAVPGEKKEDVLPEKPEQGTPPDQTPKAKLKRLKQSIRDEELPHPPVEYACDFAGLRVNWRLASMELNEEERTALAEIAQDNLVTAGEFESLEGDLREFIANRGQVYLKGLEDFGNRVYEGLWEAVKKRFELPDEPPSRALAERDPLEEEADHHKRYMESRTQVYIGREQIQQQLHAVANAHDPYGCVVIGPAGSGKSAALAKFALDYAERHPDHIVITHFIGASRASTSVRQMLRRFCLTLKAKLGFKSEVPSDTNRLVTRFIEFIEQIPPFERVVFIIDALNQLDESDNAHKLYWLPREWPDHVNCFVSCITRVDEDEELIQALKSRRNYRIGIEELSEDERLSIMAKVPSLSAKRLATGQVERLLANPATKNPLFLLVALEELRGFGSYEELDARISAFPREGDTVAAIFTQVIERLEDEFDADQVRKILSWLACSRSGLSEQELLELIEGIGVTDSKSELFPILRQIRAYLQPRGDLLDFYHRSFYKAVRDRYLAPNVSFRTENVTPQFPESGAECAAHGRLARYFEDKLSPCDAPAFSGDDTHALSDLVWHYVQARDTDAGRRILLTYQYVHAKINHLGIQALLDDYGFIQCDRADPVGLIQAALRLSSNVINNDPNQLASQLHGRLLDLSEPEIRTFLTVAGKLQPRPWLRPITRTLAVPGGPLIRTIHGDFGKVAALAIAPDGRTAVLSAEKGTLQVWNILSGSEIRVLRGRHGGASNSYAVAIAPDCRTVVSGAKHGIVIWDIYTGAMSRTLEGNARGATRLAITPDGRHLISGGSGSQNCALTIWNLKSGRELHWLKGHTSLVSAIAVTPDGTRAVSASWDVTLKVWDLAAGELIRTVKAAELIRDVNGEAHRQLLAGLHLAVAIAPNGCTVVSGTSRGPLSVWDLETGTLIRTLDGDGHRVNAIAITPDGRHAVSGTQGGLLTIWDLQTGVMVRTLEGHTNQINAIAITPDGRTAVSGSDDCTVKVWDLRAPAAVSEHRGHNTRVNALAVVPDGRTVISGSEDCTLMVWDMQRGVPIRTLARKEQNGKVTAVATSADGRTVFSGTNDGEIIEWDIESGTEIRALNGLKGIFAKTEDAIRSNQEKQDRLRFQISGGGGMVGGSRQTNDGDKLRLLLRFWDEFVRIWFRLTGIPILTLEGHSEQVNCIAATPDGLNLVSGGCDGAVKLWDLKTGAPIRTLQGKGLGSVNAVAICQDGRTAITSFILAIWDLKTGTAVRNLQVQKQPVYSVAITRDGRTALSGSSGRELKIWDLISGEEIGALLGHRGEIRGLMIAPDDRTVVSVSSDFSLKVWDLISKRCLASFFADNSIHTCAISSNGDTIVAGDDSGALHFLKLEGLS